MRLAWLLALTFLLLATACGEGPLPPPEPYPEPPPAVAPPATPTPLRDTDPDVAPPATPAPSEAVVREPPEWQDLEESLREETDPADLLIQKDLDAARIFVEFDEVPIARAAAALAERVGISIQIQPDCYEEYSPDELAVTVEPQTATVAEALSLFCARRRLVHWVEAGAVKIAPRPPEPEMVQILIPLGRLIRRGEDTGEGTPGYEPDAIADLARGRIDREVWDEGGDIRYHHPRRSLKVQAPRSTVRRILALLRELHEQME